MPLIKPHCGTCQSSRTKNTSHTASEGRRPAGGCWALRAGTGGRFGVAWGVPEHPRSVAARGMEFWRCGGEKREKVRLSLGCVGCRIGASWLQEQPNSPLALNSAGSDPAVSPHIRGRWACNSSKTCLSCWGRFAWPVPVLLVTPGGPAWELRAL